MISRILYVKYNNSVSLAISDVGTYSGTQVNIITSSIQGNAWSLSEHLHRVLKKKNIMPNYKEAGQKAM